MHNTKGLKMNKESMEGVQNECGSRGAKPTCHHLSSLLFPDACSVRFLNAIGLQPQAWIDYVVSSCQIEALHFSRAMAAQLLLSHSLFVHSSKYFTFSTATTGYGLIAWLRWRIGAHEYSSIACTKFHIVMDKRGNLRRRGETQNNWSLNVPSHD